MRKLTFQLSVMLVSFLLLTVAPIHAGWLIVDQDGATTMIADQKLKEIDEESDEGWFVMDFGAQKVTLVNLSAKTWAQASFSDYCETIQSIQKAFAAGMDEFTQEKKTGKAPRVTVEKVGPGGDIAGLPTTKYQVFADGQLHEELWVSHDAALMKEVGNAEALRRLARCTQGLTSEVESQPAYIDLISTGWVLRAVAHDMGEPELDTQAVRVERKTIPPSEFAVPAACRQVPLEAAMSGESE